MATDPADPRQTSEGGSPSRGVRSRALTWGAVGVVTIAVAGSVVVIALLHGRRFLS
jgi:hypothetical protein